MSVESLKQLEDEFSFQPFYTPYTLHKELQEYVYSSFYRSPRETRYIPGPVFGMLIELWEECFYISKDSPSENSYDYIIRHSWQVKTQATMSEGSFGNVRFAQEESVWELGVVSQGEVNFFRVRDFNVACSYVLAYVKAKRN